MGLNDDLVNKITKELSIIKTINQDPNSLIDGMYENHASQLENLNGIVKKTVTDFTSKLTGGSQNKKDIFEQIVRIAESFVGDEKEDQINAKTKPLVTTKLKKYAKEAGYKTLQQSKEIILTETKKSFFGGVGTCNPTTPLDTTGLDISPKEFDFMGMLKTDPMSITGKLIYESVVPNETNDIKFNQILYNTFTTYPYDFFTKSNEHLFSITWNPNNQNYTIYGLTPTTPIGDFIDNYYNSIEFPDIEHVLKTTTHMVLGGDAVNVEPKAFQIGMKKGNRLLKKIFSLCNKETTNQPLMKNTFTELNEDEYDIINYFDFDDVEGIDLDDEDAKYRGVLKFRDCDNFEIPLNTNYPEDFVYFLDSSDKTIDENVDDTLNNAAIDAYEESGGSIPLEGFQISIIKDFILQFPKALVMTFLSPKMFFPIILIHKHVKESFASAEEYMRSLHNLFYNIISALFWKFNKEFWLLIKQDLLKFIRKIAIAIQMNKIKRLKIIVKILINILRKALTVEIKSCKELFSAILGTINTSLNSSTKLPMPNLLLCLSEFLPGFSNDRAYMNIIRKLENAGVNVGLIYGTTNKLLPIVKCIVDGYTEEIDTNSYVKVSVKSIKIPTPVGPITIPPGILEGYGKML